MSADAAKVVDAVRAYAGTLGLHVRVQERFYQRMQRVAQVIAARHGLSVEHLLEEAGRRAAELGPIALRPGKDY